MATMERVRPRPTREFLSLREAAEWYEVGYSTLRKMVAAGQLAAHTRPADKRMYLSVEQLEAVFRPQPRADA